jgi:hypothetical protein
MPKPLSNDLRKRIIEDAEDVIAREKEVNKSTITKLWALYKETGNLDQTQTEESRYCLHSIWIA